MTVHSNHQISWNHFRLLNCYIFILYMLKTYVGYKKKKQFIFHHQNYVFLLKIKQLNIESVLYITKLGLLKYFYFWYVDYRTLSFFFVMSNIEIYRFYFDISSKISKKVSKKVSIFIHAYYYTVIISFKFFLPQK